MRRWVVATALCRRAHVALVSSPAKGTRGLRLPLGGLPNGPREPRMLHGGRLFKPSGRVKNPTSVYKCVAHALDYNLLLPNSMSRGIKLDGGEISVIKALGTSGSQLYGKLLLDKVEMMDGELIDTLDTLIAMGYVVSNRVNIRRIEDVETAFFRVNPACIADLRRSLRGGGTDETRERRRRRG